MKNKTKRSKATKSATRGRSVTESELREASGGMFDAYLKIDGIKGESQEDQHKVGLELLPYGQTSVRPSARRK